MSRVTRGTKGKRRHKKILSYAKGYVGGRGLYRQGRETVEKGLTYAYRDRKVRKREFRALWIVRHRFNRSASHVLPFDLLCGLGFSFASFALTRLAL